VTFRGFPPDALEFFFELDANNERSWWQANKQRFEASVATPMREMLDALEPEFGAFKVFRMNVDAGNFGVAESLMDILVEEGLSGKLGIYPGQIIAVDDGAPSPSTTYKSRCFTNPEFAQAELKFRAMAAERGFGSPSIPRPARAPCTAVRSNELVIGSKGELYKCWNSVGNSKEVIGHANDYRNVNGRLHKWLKYDPFSNPDCRSCIALPTCMGGCAHHAMDPIQYENRCGTFRHTYREQISTFVDAAESQSVSGPAHRTVATGF